MTSTDTTARQGAGHRIVAVLGAVAAVAALMLAGCASTASHAPAPSGTPWIGPQAAQAMTAVPRPPLVPGRHERHERHEARVITAAPVAAAPRPVWDGQGTYASGTEPLCPAALAGHTAVAGPAGHTFTVTCTWDGTEYAWGAK